MKFTQISNFLILVFGVKGHTRRTINRMIEEIEHNEKSIFITGADGFIGQNAVSYFTNKRWNVAAISRKKARFYIGDSIDTHEYSGNDGLFDVYNIFRKKCSHKTTLLNCVGYGVNPECRAYAKMIDTNISYTLMLAELALISGTPLITFGSSSEYEASDDYELKKESATKNKLQLYGMSKSFGSQLLEHFARQNESKIILLRLFNTYGMFEANHRLFPSLLKNLQNNEALKLSSGSQVRDFVYVKEVLKAVELSIESLQSQKNSFMRTYNVCSGLGMTIRDFALDVCSELDANQNLLHFAALEMRPDDVKVIIGDNSKIKRELGWQTKISLGTATKECSAHYKKSL